MKKYFCSAVGIIGSSLTYIMGGWDTALQTLILFMGVDYISGCIVAFVFHKSPKTETGGLSSAIGFKGIVKKIFMVLLVGIGHRLDILFTVDYIRLAMCFAFMANELISIVENAGLMGIKMPAVVTNAIDILSRKGEQAHGNIESH